MAQCPSCKQSYVSGEAHACRIPAELRSNLRNVGTDDTLRPSAGAPAEAADSSADSVLIHDQLTGALLGGKYEVLDRVGQGAMGSVYRARHVQLDSIVAIKVLRKIGTPAYADLFLQEARLASKVRHPNIVYIADFGVLPDDRPYVVMEFLSGRTLSSLLDDGALTPLRACSIAVQIAKGLQCAHDKDIIHRDLKPDNVFLMEQEGVADLVKVVDFGIAQHVDDPSAAWGEGGAFSGTPTYMSPEQAGGKILDFRSDQYSLGCILYEMLTGQPPFVAHDVLDVLRMHLEDTPVPPRVRRPDLEIGKGLEDLVLRLLKKSPAERFARMRDVEDAIIAENDGRLPGHRSHSSLPPVQDYQRRSQDKLAVIVRGRQVRLRYLIPMAMMVFLAAGYGAFRFLATRGAEKEKVQKELRPGELFELRQRAMTLLKQSLRSPNNEQRREALAALGESRDLSLYADLRPLLDDADNDARAEAAEALGKLGEHQAVAALLPLLEREGPAVVRVAAAHALQRLGDEHGKAALQKQLRSGDIELRIRSALSLCEQRDDEACKILREEQLRGGLSPAIQLDISTRLARAGDETAKAALRTQARRPGPLVDSLITASRLLRIGDEVGREVLRENARRKGPDQLLAARLLASADELESAELFRRVVADPHATKVARRLGCEGLGATMRPFDARLLGEQLGEPTIEEIRTAAAAAILNIANSDPTIASAQSLEWARSALGDTRWEVRRSAVAVLGDLRTAQAVPLLRRMLSDGEAGVRSSAVRALSRRPEADALDALHSGLKDSSSEVRTETLKALDRLLQTQRAALSSVVNELGSWLTELPSTASTYEQLLAAHILLQLGDRNKLGTLKTWLKAPDPALRSLYVELSDEAAALTAALADADFKVRFAAAQKLSEQGDARAIPVLREALTHGGADAVLATAALRKVDPRSSIEVDLAEVLRSGTVEKRMAAIEGMSRLSPDLAMPLLERAAGDGEALVRRLTAEVAADLKAPANAPHPALPLLRRLSADADAAVRSRAIALLERLNSIQPTTNAPPKTEATRPKAEAVPSKADNEETNLPPAAPSEAKKPNAIAQESGLRIEGPNGVWIQIDQRPWQQTQGQTIPLPAGKHLFTTLNGPQEIEVPPAGQAALRVSPSKIEEFAQVASSQVAQQNWMKAQPNLEKASVLCAKLKTRPLLCTELSFELSYCRSALHESRRELAEAMTELQKAQALGGTMKGHVADKAAIHQAIERLTPKLGQVIITRQRPGGCTEVRLWKAPGSYIILDAQNQSHQVRVRAGEVTKVGDC